MIDANQNDTLASALKALKRSEAHDPSSEAGEGQDVPSPSHENLSGDGITFLRAVRRLESSFEKAARFCDRTAETGKYVYQEWAKPAWHLIEPAVGGAWRGYRAAFSRIAYTRDEDGNRVFSTKRAAAATLASVILAGSVIQYGIPLAVQTTYDGAMLLRTQETSIYLNKAQELDEPAGVHQTSGCFSYPCGADDTMYFRMRDNIILDARNWVTRGHGYYPEDVAGAIANETNKCDITYYGVRNKTLGWYPYITEARCTPVSFQRHGEGAGSVPVQQAVPLAPVPAGP